jgi:cytochrome oxidase assembly protein ShyY1
VLRAAIWTLRQRRYAAMAALMLAIAAICVVAGTWQISRFEQSVRDNNALDANAQAAAVPLTTMGVPLVNHGPAPGRDAIRYRSVTATGSYAAGAQQLVINQTVNGTYGLYVLTPLRTATGELLVVRGFVAAKSDGTAPAKVAAAPTGTVHITGQLQTPSTSKDGAAQLGSNLIGSINPAEQVARRGAATYDAYVTLAAGQPGTAGLTVLPDPDLSNPAGGAYEWQHFAYIIQWYLFALLALVAPFLIARHEVREARRQFLGIDPATEEFAGGLDGEPDRPQLAGANSGGGGLALRDGATLARRDGPTAEQWQRAVRLADRYGRSLQLGDGPPGGGNGSGAGRLRRTRRTGAGRREQTTSSVTNSATGVHRSNDGYHGSYNDYLWEIALADGNTPDISLRPPPNPADDDEPS